MACKSGKSAGKETHREILQCLKWKHVLINNTALRNAFPLSIPHKMKTIAMYMGMDLVCSLASYLGIQT